MVHFDTSFLIDVMRETARRKSGPATALLESLADEDVGTSVHVACELFAGAEMSRDPERERAKVESVLSSLSIDYPDDRFPTIYGKLLAKLERHGQSISTMDLLVATAAVRAGAAPVTRNVREFSRIPELVVMPY